MAEIDRRQLTIDEKQELLYRHRVCYLCQETLEGYDEGEIEFDHIYSFADGYSQDISNFAPVHASTENGKLNCHKAKGRKNPVAYREELRIQRELASVKGLADICPRAICSVYSISQDFRSILFNGTQLPLYNQRIDSVNHYFFFHEIELKYIENDDEIQLRPLEPKILKLILSLQKSVQLFPSLARLDPESKTLKLFDGQHKAIAQKIGNNRDRIQCIVFVHPDVAKLRVTVYEAHTDFVQQKYKKSHIDAKLADIYSQKIEAYRQRIGNPDASYSEAVILGGESKSDVRKHLMSWIISEIQERSSIIKDYAAESRADQRNRPILWQSIERFVLRFANLEAVSEPSESEKNFRSDEIANLVFILDRIREFSLQGKWTPENSDSHYHRQSRTYFYRTAFNNWIEILEKALRHALEQRTGDPVYGALCYRNEFSSEEKRRFSEIIRKLFDHPLWVQEEIQNEIAKTNQDSVAGAIFKREGLHHIYLAEISRQ